jgi:hypothetical protein
MESHACDLAGISVQAFRRYVSKDNELADLFGEAQVRGYDRLADELLYIDVHGAMLGLTDAKMVKVLSDNRKWLLEKRRPQHYGQRSIVEHNITADRAIIEALSQGKQRALEGVVIDTTYKVVSESVRVHGVDIDPDLLEFVGD